MKIFGRKYIAMLVLLGMLCAIPTANAAAEHIASREYPLKAAFVYNFIKFTRWTSCNQPQHNLLYLAVAGPDPFGDVLHPLEEKTADGKAIKLTNYSELSGLRRDHCQVVFVAYQQHEMFIRVLAVCRTWLPPANQTRQH